MLWEMLLSPVSPSLCLDGGSSLQPVCGTAASSQPSAACKEPQCSPMATNPLQHLLCPTQAGNQLAEVQPPTCFPRQAKGLGRELHPAHHCLSKGQMRCTGKGGDETRNELYLPPIQADFSQGTFSKLTAASQTPELLVLLKRSPCFASPCRRRGLENKGCPRAQLPSPCRSDRQCDAPMLAHR